MIAPLYTKEILRLAVSLPEHAPLERVDAAAEERSPTCGSRIRTEVQLDNDGRVIAITQQVQACAFGQASAALVAAHAQGQGHEEISAAAMALDSWLAGERDDPGEWPGLSALAPARSRAGRHGAILLPFKTLLSALEGGRR